MNVPNALTVDVEDYFHVAALAPSIHRDSWTSRESRVVESTRKLLAIFDQFGVRGTFFVLAGMAPGFETPNGRHPDCPRRLENPASGGLWRPGGFWDSGYRWQEAGTSGCCDIGCRVGDWRPSADANCDRSCSTCTLGKSIRR